MTLSNFIKTLVEYGIIKVDDTFEVWLDKIQLFFGKLEGKMILDGNEVKLG